ncbi:MAG: hypothetical protein CMB80_00925, partial [Flammeovirgaceae bacterium]|nr:hypothetical protein [Flammeovirgaceae bacterium]
MNWYHLLKLAGYEEFADEVERAATQNPYPFSSWFDANGRAYFPFGSEEQQFDEDVKDILDDTGCTITDYRGGYCQKGKNSFRIGKVLEQEKRKALKELEQRFQAGEIYNLEREIQDITKSFDDIINTFVNSPYRVQKAENQFTIVISQNPQDVATMSTGRDWTSCMELGSGSQHHDVFCEIKRGGLVAYLIRGDDPDIKNPLARIHIRRFTNRQGQSIAIPEESVYGNEITGFQEMVKNWLTERQGDIIPGIYERQGGEYSDTFQNEMLIPPTEQEGILQWFRGEDPNAQYSTWVVRDEMYDEIKDMYEDTYKSSEIENLSKEFTTREEAERYLEIVTHSDQNDYEREAIGQMAYDEDDPESWSHFDDEKGEWERQRFSLEEKKTDHRAQIKSEAAKQIINAEKGTYSPEILQQVKEYVFNAGYSSAAGYKDFITKYPELLTEDEINNLDINTSLQFITSLPEEQQSSYKAEWQGIIINNINSFLKEKLSETDESGTKTHIDTVQHKARLDFDTQVMNPIKALFEKQIPEPIIQKLVQYANSLESIGYLPAQKLEKEIIPGKPKTTDHISGILAEIIHVLSMANADTPSVQQFYNSLLSKWDNSPSSLDNYSVVGITTLGGAIGRLGENGRQFIPFMQKKLEEAKTKRQYMEREEQEERERQVKSLDKYIERLLHIIDSLESGTGSSKKYKFFKNSRPTKTGTNWYTQQMN